MAKWPNDMFRRLAGLTLSTTALVYFYRYFEEYSFQPTVDLAWLVAVCGWMFAWWQRSPSRIAALSQPFWAYALYVLVLAQFATNWRWVMAGDSLSWLTGGIYLAEAGPAKSVLSIFGVAQFSYTQMVAHDIFMVLFEPSHYWHRFGQIIFGALSFAAVYSVYARLVHPRFGLLVAACSLTTSVTLVHTYCSYPLIDAIAIGHLILAIALWIRAEPESRTAWLLLGLSTGMMLFLTPNSWILGLSIWAWLGILALRRRWPLANAFLAAGLVLIVGLPVLLQMCRGQGAEMLSLLRRGEDSGSPFRLFWQALIMPFYSDQESAGAFGPQLPQWFRWLFIPGILLAPTFSRRFPGARLILAFYVVQLLFMSVTQGPYFVISVKRALVLIPMATYFVFLPFQRWLKSLPVVLVVIAVWSSFAIVDLTTKIRPGRTGYTFVDGLVELRQRLDGAPVCIFLSREYHPEAMVRGEPLERAFDIATAVRRVTDVNDPQCAHYMCYVPAIDPHVSLADLGYKEFPMLGTVEMRCGSKVS